MRKSGDQPFNPTGSSDRQSIQMNDRLFSFRFIDYNSIGKILSINSENIRTESEMTDPETPKSELADELRNLGKNLEDFIKTMWASEERKNVQKNIEASATQVSASLNQAAKEFTTSDTGQRLKADVEDIQRRFESGELQDKAHTEMLNVLKWINTELDKVSTRYSSSNPEGDETKKTEE